MKVIARFYFDCGRMGVVEGLFITTKEELDAVYGEDVYFGEILGKHSEISCRIKEEHITIVSDDQDFIKKVEDILGTYTISGYNPLDYIDEPDYEDEDEE